MNCDEFKIVYILKFNIKNFQIFLYTLFNNKPRLRNDCMESLSKDTTKKDIH